MKRQRWSLLFGGRIYIPFLSTLAVLHKTILHNRVNCTRMIERKGWIHSFLVLSKSASAARNWINSSPKTEATTFAFSSVFILLLWCSLSQDSDIFQYSIPEVIQGKKGNASPPPPSQHLLIIQERIRRPARIEQNIQTDKPLYSISGML